MVANSSGVWREILESGGVFVYKCVANNSVGSTYSTDVTFSVNVPPSIQPINNKKVIKGDNVTVMCKVSGMPPPMVSWIKPNGQRQSGYMLRLVTISRKEAGEYKCEASNKCGNATEMATIDVQYAPTITNISGGQTVNKGKEVSLFCMAEGNPAPTITWTKVADNSTVNFPLIIRGSRDEGLYRCTAENRVGSSVTKDVSIIVHQNPCLEECTNGRNCREFGKYLCLCPKGKTGQNCKENDTMAVVLMISLKIDNKKWREELTDLSDLDTQGFVGVIVDSVDEEFKGSGVREINVTRLREGSVIADISLTFGEPVGESEVESFLQDAVNDGSLGILKVGTFAVGPTLPDLVTVPGPVPSEPTKVNKDVIYGSVIGVLGLILAVIAVFIAWKHRKRERDDRLNAGTRRSRILKINEGFELESISENLSNVAYYGPGHHMDLNEVRSLNGHATDPTRSYLEINEYAPLHPGTRSWEVERENVTIEKVIGKGAFGQVAQGKASNVRGREETITVAIKMLKGNARDLERKDLLSELEIMKKLKPHPHVIKLLGCVTKSDPLLVLIEYVPYGDLRGYLRKSRQLEDNHFNDPDIKPQTGLTSQQLMKFSWQVADGMHYLSSKNIIHRDLAARNVLVGERERCKVTDFGMARDVCQENIYERKSEGRLPVKWTASEALLYGRYTTKSDV
ncbi:fibroblast growth factor receptor 3-like [Stylophora pistillata]|uniref:fibroblast growth factor receptor 3-like n=1 Tax=Stylophora pistillata TaxID=50429 RepID=UPI000C051651|nr:fibroblast growth factor receptor 3-like [Stylophora pistillata]